MQPLAIDQSLRLSVECCHAELSDCRVTKPLSVSQCAAVLCQYQHWLRIDVFDHPDGIKVVWEQVLTILIFSFGHLC